MDERNLYTILDYILNRADESDLDAIRAALRRRESDSPGPGRSEGPMGIDLRGAARRTAKLINEQLGVNRKQIRDMLDRSVRKMLAEQAPELGEEQVDRLVKEWLERAEEEADRDRGLVDSGGEQRSRGDSRRDTEPSETGPAVGRRGAEKGAGKHIPSDALLTMIKQFISYSTGAMGVREEMQLKEEMSDWHERYWKMFPQVVRRLVTLFLKGTINSEEFWQGIDESLGDTGSEDPTPDR